MKPPKRPGQLSIFGDPAQLQMLGEFKDPAPMPSPLTAVPVRPDPRQTLIFDRCCLSCHMAQPIGDHWHLDKCPHAGTTV